MKVVYDDDYVNKALWIKVRKLKDTDTLTVNGTPSIVTVNVVSPSDMPVIFPFEYTAIFGSLEDITGYSFIGNVFLR